MDVTSQYTNIDIPMWIQAAKDISNTFRPQIGLKPTNETLILIGLLELVLTKNNFQFNNQHHLQIKGCFQWGLE